MKERKLEDIRKRNKERQEDALTAARRVDKDFYKGKRTNRFYGREDKEKGRILEEKDKIEKERIKRREDV